MEIDGPGVSCQKFCIRTRRRASDRRTLGWARPLRRVFNWFASEELERSAEVFAKEAIQDLNIFINNCIELWKLSITVAPVFPGTDMS